MPRGNPQNFKPKTSEERRKNASKAGKASGVAKRQRKAMREQLLEMLSLPCEELEGLTNEQAGLVAMLKKWQLGDVSAGVFVRDTIGEKPVDQAKVEAKEEVVYKWKGAK